MDPFEISRTKEEEKDVNGANYNEGFDSTDDEKNERKEQVEVGGIHVELSPEEEDNILEKLREVVRKCTNVDPNKRPTAAEVLTLLDVVNRN